jgi:hypothetical protein
MWGRSCCCCCSCCCCLMIHESTHRWGGLEHVQWCSVCDSAKILLTSKFSYLLLSNTTTKTAKKYFAHPSLVIYFSPTPPINLKTGTASRWETTNSNPPGPIKLSSQSTTVVRPCSAFYQCKHPVDKYRAKTNLLSQMGHLLTFSSFNFL